jgi:hypothetical protein
VAHRHRPPAVIGAGPRTVPAAEPLEARRLLAASVSGLTLVDSVTDQPVPGFVLGNGSVIDLRQTGRRLNIVADLAGSAASVRFNYDANPAYRLDGAAPYVIGGSSGADYASWTPALGTHTLVVTPYHGAGGTGARGGSRTVTFTVVDTTPQAAPVRVNAGGSAFTTADGRAFAADTNFSGGSKLSGTFSVAGTSDDTLYRSRREGSGFTFSKGVPNDTYLVTLHFAEPSKTARGQRKFDVRAEGKLALDDFDVFAAAGANKSAVTRTLTVPVADGRLDLAFAGVVSSAIVSAVEVVPAPRAPAVPAPVRVNAGGGKYVDALGRRFEADTGFNGGAAGRATYDVLLPPDAPGSSPLPFADDPLLLDWRAGTSFTFARPIANGNYAVWLEFAEPVAGRAAGQRVFDVSAEGALVLNDYDVVADAGAAQLAVAKTFNVSVRDGRLDLSFKGVVGEALVGAIAVVPTDIPAAALPYAGVSGSADPVKNAAHDRARLVRSAANMGRVFQAIVTYGNEHRGQYPSDLASLVLSSGGFTDHAPFSSPRAASAFALPRGELSLLEQVAWVDAARDYVYVGAGLNFTAGATVWVAYENPDRVPGERLNVMYADGRIADVARADVLARYGGSPTGPTIARPLDAVADAKVSASRQNLLRIGQALNSYQSVNRGAFPPDFGTLYESGFLTTAETFANPRGPTPPPSATASDAEKVAWINASTDYVFRAAGRRSFAYAGEDVVAYENPADMPFGINLLFGDGRVEFREMRWALESIARPLP